MSRSFRMRRVLALTSALVLATLGTAAAASADPGHGSGKNSAHGQSTAPGQAKDHQPKDNQPPRGHHSGSNGGSHGSAGGSHGSAGGHHDPAGNNGTIKITPLGEQDGTPDNHPHVTCGFQIEWYGFDEGDYRSQVSFAMQSPTRDASITPNGPRAVFVGADPASGAGTDSGLDAREQYFPSFTGTPHPQQGYHVKVTVATPFSQGNDTKSKVFWVQPCDAGSTAGGDDDGSGDNGGDDSGSDAGDHDGTGGNDNGEDTDSGDTAGDNGTLTSDSAVLGVEAESGPIAAAGPVTTNSADVPTAVDAGEGGQSALDWVRSPLPLLVIALGAGLAVAAFATRRRNRVDV